jgi:hypothetical protein
MPKAGMACALCRYAIDLVAPLEQPLQGYQHSRTILRASTIWRRTAEAQRLNALYAKKQTRSDAKDLCTSPKDASKSRKLSHSGRKRLQTG